MPPLLQRPHKPEWAGQAKPSYEQKQIHKSEMQEKRGPGDKIDKREDKNGKQGHYEEHYEDRDKQRHEGRHEDHNEQDHEKRNKERDLQGGSDKTPQPNEDNRGFKQRMKDLPGWQ